MTFLIFVGLVVLFFVVFDSRKTIKYLRARIEDLEYGLSEVNSAVEKISAPVRNVEPVPGAEPLRRARPKRIPDSPRLTEEAEATASVEQAAEAPEHIEPVEEEAPASAGKRFEDLIGGKLPIWIGGIALVFAGFFLVRFSIEAGLFGPAARCATAALFGLLLIGAAEFGHRIPRLGRIFTDDLRIGHSVAGAGVAVLYATLYMASELYGLLGLTSALTGVIAITILAFLLSQKHGPPTAIMGLIGGLAAPYVAGVGPDSIAPLVIYLGIFTAGLFGLAIHRGWAWLALLATGGSVIWTTALLFMDISGDSSLVGIFIILLAIGGVLTLSRTDRIFGVPKVAMRSIPLAAGLVQLIILAPLIEYSPASWLFFAVLAIFAIALSWRDAEMTPAAAGALGLTLAMVAAAFSDHGPDQGDLLPAIGFAVLFGLAGHVFALREKDGSIWAFIGLAAPTGMLVVAAILGRLEWTNNGWGAACFLVGISTGIMAWRTRLQSGLIVLAVASALTAIFLTAALWLWTPERFAAIIIVLVAAGLAAWARYCNSKAVAGEAFAAAITGGVIAANSSSGLALTLFASLSGETGLYDYLPDPWLLLPELLIPCLALLALAYVFRGILERHLAAILAIVGLIGSGAFGYLLLKQILAIGSIEQFVQYGFAERAIFTHLFAAAGWLLLRRPWPGEWIFTVRMLGWTLAAIALFRFVYFDLLLLSPTNVRQMMGPAPFANLGTSHYGAVALWLWLFARTRAAQEGADQWIRSLEIGSMIATVAAVMVTVRQAVHGSIIALSTNVTSGPGGPVMSSGPGYTTTETYLYSASLLLLAIAWLARGIQTTNALLRIGGLLLLTLVTFKVFLIDAQLDGILRILSFLGLGFALIGIGWIYGKLMKRENPGATGNSGG
ncbi:MAG: DUF2339 domain-containing protein [Parasphingorhabdus sp.]